MNLCYRGVRYNAQSTNSVSSNSRPVFKYRGVSYYHESLAIAQELSAKKLTYRGVPYSQDGSEPDNEVKTIRTLKPALN